MSTYKVHIEPFEVYDGMETYSTHWKALVIRDDGHEVEIANRWRWLLERRLAPSRIDRTFNRVLNRELAWKASRRPEDYVVTSGRRAA
jgi:hypothetical protein